MSLHRRMSDRLLKAFAQPTERFCYYSANSAATGSDRLNRTPFWDWTPARTHDVPGGCTHMVPLAFGCRPIRTTEGNEWFEKLISDPAQVKDIGVADIYAGRAGEVLDNVRTVLASLPEGDSIRQPDMQSPLGVAELIWDESFYTCLIEHPGAIHELLNILTEFIIRWLEELRRIAGDRLNSCGFPLIWDGPKGYHIADDTMSLISPEMHREFSLPYLNRITEAVGPIHYHSCTWRKKYFANLHALTNVRSLNWNPGNSDDPDVILGEFSGKAVITPHLVLGMHRDNDVLKFNAGFADEAEFFRYFLDCMRENTCLYWWFSNIRDNGPVMQSIHALLDERGYTPRACGLT